MTVLQISLGLLAILLLAWWGLRQRGRSAASDSKSLDRIDTVAGWPPQPTRLFSTQERLAFGTLSRALPDYMILAQVPLARFINVPRRNSYADWLRRIGNQCVDFLVCDMASQVIAVVEIQAQQPSENARKRMSRIQRTLKAAKLPLLVWTENALPSSDAARAQILPAPPAASPATPAAANAAKPPSSPAVTAAAGATASATAAQAPTAANKPNPFDDDNRDSTQDEMIELLEPPPSTWYDDLDTKPTPLKKR